MNALDGIIDDLNTQTFALIEKDVKPCTELWQNINRFIKNLEVAVEEYKTTGKAPECNSESWETFEVVKGHNSSKNKPQRSSIKENVQPNENEPPEDSPIKTRRPRRNAFKEATENINKQSSITLSTKLRRPTCADDFQNVYIKKEKVSLTVSENASDEVKVKTEAEEMPAPARPAPRRKRQKKTDSQVVVKTEKSEEETTDVVAQETQINGDDKTMKGKQKLAKRPRSVSSDEESTQKNEKRAKSPCEDFQIIENNNATFTSKSSETVPNTMNATVVIENPKFVNNNNNNLIADDLMTDDESEDEKKVKSPPTLIKTVTKSVKQIFSPFERSPVKKKIEAFEKLKQDCNTIPVRVTRTKSRAQVKEQAQEQDQCAELESNVKEKAKFFTPDKSNKFVPAASSTIVKSSRLTPNHSLLSVKSTTYKEREKKELEALKKREALMQAQKEEKRRKREEKQLKAQQQREVLEKEKLKALEAQRLKDERHRQLLLEQEQKKQKQKEELEKKRLMAKMRAIEEKRKEEAKRLEEQRKAEEIAAKLAKQDEEMAKLVQKKKQANQQVPVYMTTKAPMLPTDDCYDSDDEEFKHTQVKEASWARGSSLKDMQYYMIAAGEAIKNSFFSRLAQTPDLQEIFEVIHPEKLKRSSSATWHKPPRYTMCPFK